MKNVLLALFTSLLVWFMGSCSSTVETVKPPTIESKEMVYKRGHQLYVQQHYDSADAVLKRALALDTVYLAALSDLADMHYTLGMSVSGESNPLRRGHLREAQDYFGRIEALGQRESDVYERLCEVSHALKDDRAFLKYAKKNAEAFPYDRQYVNLGIAYFEAGDYASVIKTQKAATEKFRSSAFVGAFYKQMGRAYMKVDRDQTAERTFVAGLQAADARIAELKKSRADYKSTDDYRRLVDDKIGMLLLLKKLHQTYDAKDKLGHVERQLKELGYTK